MEGFFFSKKRDDALRKRDREKNEIPLLICVHESIRLKISRFQECARCYRRHPMVVGASLWIFVAVSTNATLLFNSLFFSFGWSNSRTIRSNP